MRPWTTVLSPCGKSERVGLCPTVLSATTFWSFVREFSSLRPVKQLAGVSWYFGRSCFGKTVAHSLLFRSALHQGCSEASYILSPRARSAEGFVIAGSLVLRGMSLIRASHPAKWRELAHKTPECRGKQHVRTTQDVSCAVQCGVPRSTARGWLTAPSVEVVTLDSLNMDAAQLQREVFASRLGFKS